MISYNIGGFATCNVRRKKGRSGRRLGWEKPTDPLVIKVYNGRALLSLVKQFISDPVYF